MSETPPPQQDRLLAVLPGEVGHRLFPELEWVSVPVGRVLYDLGGVPQTDRLLPSARPMHLNRPGYHAVPAMCINQGMEHRLATITPQEDWR